MMPLFKTMHVTGGKLAAPLTAFWLQRNQRERSMLGCAAVFILLALVYLLLIEPAVNGRVRLQKSLPVVRQQASELHSLLAQAAGLNGGLASQPAPPAPQLGKDTIEATLKRKGLNAQNVALSGDIAKIQLSGVAFADLLDWLADIQKTEHWQLLDLNVSAQEEVGMVNAGLTLMQQKHE